MNAIDNDCTMITIAKQSLARTRAVAVARQDITSTRFPTGYFDAGICCNVLFLLADPQPAIREAFRTLRSGGLFVVTGPTPYADLRVLFSEMRRSLAASGVLAAMRHDAEILRLANTRFQQNFQAPLLEPKSVRALLAHSGFSRIVHESFVFLRQSYFIVAMR
ncbi:MAG: methyltransferase domain-containing protein [Acidobacteria bacterium]|nr:methyltransferase domain-containing protein [Acidobacteriota bacterium]